MLFLLYKKRNENMNTKYLVVTAIVAIAIILGSVAAYVYLSQPASTQTITLQGAGATFPISVAYIP